MKQISIIKDAIRNMPHVIIVNNEKSIQSFPVTEFGKKIEKEAIRNGVVNSSLIPDGFTATKFKQINPQIESLLSERFGEMFSGSDLSKDVSILEKSLNKHFILREKSLPSVRIYGVADRAISSVRSKINKSSLIDYKARRFVMNSLRSSMISSIKTGGIRFDSQNNVLVGAKSNIFGDIAVDAAVEKVGAGSIRRMLNIQDREDISTKNRRVKRRAAALSSVESESQSVTGIQRMSVSSKSRLG